MQSPHAVLRLLNNQRDKVGALPERTDEFGAAVCEVLDELIRRAQVIADEYPQGEAMTRTLIEEMPAVVKALEALMHTADVLNATIREYADTVKVHRDPIQRFIARLEAEGYDVADDWTITDTFASESQGESADPDALVQHEAEKITRAQQAIMYRERIGQMTAAFEKNAEDYTERVRNVIKTALDG